MSPLRLVVVVCCFGVPLCAAPVPPDRAKPLPYYPTQKGTKWVYEYDGGELTHVVTAVEDKDAGKLVTVEKEVSGKITPLWTVSVSEKGLFQIAEGKEKLEVPLPLLILPAKRGDKWELDHTSRSAKLKGTVSVGEVEQIEVPAGKYAALRVDWDYKIDDTPQRRTFWYAPGVGMVKMKTRINELRLKSFHLGKD
jgi:hypothetical protein